MSGIIGVGSSFIQGLCRKIGKLGDTKNRAGGQWKGVDRVGFGGGLMEREPRQLRHRQHPLPLGGVRLQTLRQAGYRGGAGTGLMGCGW